MRTTLTIDDDLYREIRDRAHGTGRPLKSVVNEALRNGLAAPSRPRPGTPYHATTFHLGLPKGVDLTKALALAAALEDEEIARELELRK